MALKPGVETLKSVILLNACTEAEWVATNPVLMANMMCFASDTSVIKIGDGVKKWSETPVYYSPQMMATMQTYLFVADIAARDALAIDKRNGLVIVIDASSDPTVTDPTKKQAGYVWDASLKEGAGDWNKIFEQESVDIDLSGYFDMVKNTADDILDGTTKVMMTVTERAELVTLTSDAVRYTDTIVIAGVTAQELAGYYTTV